MTAPAVAGLLLAAGAGRRLGRPKAQVRFGDELLVERGVRLLRDGGCDPVVVVLGAAAADVRDAADLAGAGIVVNADWDTGMGSSLQAGLTALRSSPATAVVVALVDQPLIAAQAVARLIGTWRDARAPAVVATYAGRRRNPVLLDRQAWDEVCTWAVGDQGARGYLRQLGERLVTVPCDGLGRPDDVDTVADLNELSRQQGREEQPCS